MLNQNQKGFSLAELAVTLGISSLFTVMFMRYSLNTQNQDRHLRYQAVINETLNTIQYALMKPEVCSKLLKDKTVSSTGTDIAGGLEYDGRILLKVGTYQDFNVSFIRLADSALSATNSFDLLIRFTPRETSILNSYFAPSNSVIDKRISIVGVKNGALVKSCGPIISDANITAKASFCNSIGGNLAYWDSVNKKCILKTTFKCSPGNVPNRFRSTGLECTHIMGRIKIDTVFDFGVQECTSKNFTLYQNPTNNKIAIGCPPTPAMRAYHNKLPADSP